MLGASIVKREEVQMSKKALLLSGAVLGAAFTSFNVTTVFSPSDAAEVPKEIIAAQIRKQGYDCVNPTSAVRAGETPLDDRRWILHCEGVSYRVTLVPDLAAMVEKLPNDSSEGSGSGSGQPD
jgi:hypothetical protein